MRIRSTKDVPDFSPLVDGWYPLTISAITEKVDKNRDDYLNLEYQVGDSDRKVWDTFHLMETRLWKLKKLLKVIDESLIEKDFDSDELIGKRVMAHIVKDGKWSRIQEYQSIENSEPKDLEEKEEAMPF